MVTMVTGYFVIMTIYPVTFVIITFVRKGAHGT